ncbi:protein of unknown function DUF938 [Gloeothece citriformis PCC 7424]|uniref:SAM-dependent methyltransferase n=1 Tax=Gloeothece citriformis (strain PCC 7424) TaxID=65393 RepID=B7KBY9_GLOC7|nr:DUF938 domain-containing protein [Gloeothece citriformis]ACK68812.1 protein of unknown function DUF938 [Gloeothece citriformis PCC 7424]
MVKDARQFAPATERNRDPILKVLQEVLPSTGNILEIASGTGEHAVYFAPHFAPRQWLPSDPNPMLRESINAWQQYYQVDNMSPALTLEVCEPVWDVETENRAITAIICINMIHISPPQASLGLMAGAGRILPSGGILYLYGAYKQEGKHTSPSNEDFDRFLKQQNPDWGVRDLEEVVIQAKNQGLNLIKTVQMPANNLSVVFQRQ